MQQESIPLWAKGARQIQPLLGAAGLYVAYELPSRLLLAYCLYWWKATTKGYAFEVEILRDLSPSHLRFTAHDPRLRSERFTSYDLMISGFKGDIKTSTYFLRLSTQRLKSQFYITRLWLSKTRSRTLVVFQKTLMWDKMQWRKSRGYAHRPYRKRPSPPQPPSPNNGRGGRKRPFAKRPPSPIIGRGGLGGEGFNTGPLLRHCDKINGDTLPVDWHQLQFNLPQPMRIILQSGEFVVTDYEIWKEKIRAYQTEEETKDAAPKNA